MNIICCGAGHVGRSAAEALVAAQHQVTVVDLRLEPLRAIGEGLDVQTLCGNCANADVLRTAGADSADLVLASTNGDEVNLLTASVAKAVGARKSIARVHHSAYFHGRGLDYLSHLGIDELICPEFSTAQAIASKLRSPGAIFIENFAGNKIHMQQFPVGAPVAGRSLDRLSLPPGVRLAAITRAGMTFIPTAATVLEKADLITMVANTEVFQAGRAVLAGGKPGRRRVAIMGGSSEAVWLCRALEGRDFAIRLFERNRERAEELAEKLDWVTVIADDPTEPTVFEEEHLAEVDVFVGVAGEDEHNILACAWAKSRGVREAIAVLEKTNYEYLLPHVGVDHAINPRIAAVRDIENTLDAGPVRRAAELAEGSIDVFQVRVGPEAALVGKALREVKLPAAGVIVAIQHEKEVFVPGGDDTVQAGDRLLVIGTKELEKVVRRFFAVV
jgi:trk system potassium uptake protein TrkA